MGTGNELNFGVTDPSKYEQYAKNMKSYIEAIDKTRPITLVIIIHTGYDITHTGISVIKLLRFWQIREKD